MSSQTLVAALLILAACSKDNGDSNPGSTDDSSTGDDSGSGDDSGGSKVDADKDGYDSTVDCDDTDAAVNPAATEVCDGIDNDCVGGADDGVTTDYFMDGDADGHGAGTAMPACEAPTGYVESSDDCDDTAATAYPGGTEVCDGLDNNCDSATDEGVTSPFYMDGDGDGYGAGTATDACAAPTDYVDNADDCDDLDGTTNPDADEVCDKIDNDCDTDVDDDDSGVSGGSTWYRDSDADGYGDYYTTTTACVAPAGYVADSTDCADWDAAWHTSELRYYDNDLDGYGSWYTYVCFTSDYFITTSGDCDDSNEVVYPGAPEVCDGDDNDCDTYVDADDKDIIYTTWYYDGDEDGYGDTSTATDTCEPKAGYVTASGDCDDAQWLVSPGRSEYCDGIDNNCDGFADETSTYVDWYRDDDGDHYGQDSDVINDCAPPKGYDLFGGDCDDANTEVHPGLEEVCGDDLDNECDGYVDNCLSDLDDALLSFSGTGNSSYIGWSVAGGDVDGDGTADLIVGTPQGTSYMGEVYVVNGTSSGDLTTADADATLTGYSYEQMGYSVDAGDVDGDGFDDVLTGAAWTSKAFLFMGPVTSTSVLYADASITSVDPYTYFGYQVAVADVDGDGNAETAVAEPYEYTGYGKVSVYWGLSGSPSPDLVVTGATSGGSSGAVANVGDVDGDGIDELAQGAWYGGATQQGEVFLLDTASSSGTVSASTIAVATMTGEASYDRFGEQIAGGDYDGDGHSDLFVTAIYADATLYGDEGRVYGWLGPVSGSYGGSSAEVIISGQEMYRNLGTDVALGDVTGDGAADVVIGAQYAADYYGRAYLSAGPTTGSIDVGPAISFGEPDDEMMYDYIGWSVGTLGDWSGDGADEVILGAYGMPYGSNSYSGRTWVVSSDDL